MVYTCIKKISERTVRGEKEKVKERHIQLSVTSIKKVMWNSTWSRKT